MGKRTENSNYEVCLGSPAPLLSKILLDDLDKELEKRSHCFCRYADDVNYVRNLRAMNG